jgi:two-component system sensor histidine kinase KdpD
MARGSAPDHDLWQVKRVNPLAMTAIVLFAATSLAMIAKLRLGEGYAALIFVVGIMLIGAISGLVRAVTTAIVGAAAFNFFVVDPVWRFTFATASDFVAPLVFLLCAVISGGLSGRLRDQSRLASLANVRLESLLNASRDLQPVRAPTELSDVLQRHLPASNELAIRLFWLIDRRWQPLGLSPVDPDWDAAARLVLDQSADAPARKTLRKEAITDGKVMLGALVYQPGKTPAEDIAFITALARLSSLALTRLRLDTEVAESRALARSEELKTALLSSVSHDLRTPLTTISTAASSMLAFGSAIDAQTRGELLANIVEECGRLNHLTENLLQMSRLQAGAQHLSGHVLTAQDMIRRCTARLRAQGDRRDFVIAVPDDEVLVLADAALFELALLNVMQNAVKFSADGSRIMTECTVQDSDCVIAITDEGIGVPPAEQAKVFERFHRADARATGPKGSGLGLAIAKGFVEASGGSIALASPVHDGRGTTITIRLPLAQEEHHP